MARSNSDKWLPTTKKETEARGWGQPDVVLFSGDAYVDHPSFGPAVIARVLENEGLKVAVVPQPNWQDDLRDFRKFGAPRLFFAVTAGNMDSMVNHYTAAKRLRSDDAYTPGGKAGFRPDYPTIVYTQILKKIFPDVPVLIGGIEASMRRLAHYDYWKDKVEPSILVSSGADLLVYGMGEKPVREIVTRLAQGEHFRELKTIQQTVFKCDKKSEIPEAAEWEDKLLHSFEAEVSNKKLFAENFVLFEKASNMIDAPRLIEPTVSSFVVMNPPFAPATQEESDSIYDLPFTYLPHPRYNGKDTIPAWEMIKFSVNIHRGCFGGCSFCAIAAHQGKQVVSRSEKSIVREINKISMLPGFKGYLSDLGGPSANMYGMTAKNIDKCRRCSRPSCIWPSVCQNLNTSHKQLNELYEKVRSMGVVKKAFVGSGVRYDLLFREGNPSAGREEDKYLRNLIMNHVSGRLKVAPEHTDPMVLNLMRKAPFNLFSLMKKRFDETNRQNNLKYEMVPYFISSHPGCTDQHMQTLADITKSLGLKPEQVQDFTPTPMTLSTLIYYTGFDPYTGKNVFTAKKIDEKRRQKEFFFWYRKPVVKSGTGYKKKSRGR